MRPKWNPEHIEAFINEMEEEAPRWKKIAGVTAFGAVLVLLFLFDVQDVSFAALAPAVMFGGYLGRLDSKREFVEKLERDCVDAG